MRKLVALINIASSNFERGGRYEIKKGQILWKAKITQFWSRHKRSFLKSNIFFFLDENWECTLSGLIFAQYYTF